MQHVNTEYELVNHAFEQFTTTLQEITKAAQDKWQQFKTKRAAMEEKVAECSKLTNEQKVVSLNIGGTVFNTTESTLLKEKDSFFWALLHSGQWKPDEATGQYFVDRSPQTFGIILDYLRDGKVWKMRDLTLGDRQMLRNELDFYGIASFPSFPTGLTWDPNAIRGDPTSFSLDTSQTLTISTLPANHERVIHTTGFLQCATQNQLKFTLTMISPDPTKLGHPGFYFGDFGVALHSGSCTWNHGVDWRAFLDFPVGPGSSSTVYHFQLDLRSLQLIVVGPGRDSKSVTLPKWVESANLVCQSTSQAIFHIESTD